MSAHTHSTFSLKDYSFAFTEHRAHSFIESSIFFQYYKSRANRTKIQQKHATSKWNPVTINCVRRMDLRMWAFVCEPAFNLGGASLCHWARIFATSQIFFFGNSLVTSLLRCLEIFVGFTRAIWLFSDARDWRPSKTRSLEELTECELI